ncbi:hypothetical protein BH24DEI2_BH24DEI2_05450 [soil metagenome]
MLSSYHRRGRGSSSQFGDYMRFILFSFLLVLLSSCSATTGENATAGENVPPTVRILEPAANSVVSVGTKVDVVA